MPCKGRLTGKVCLVTGAGQGIGEAIARRFVDEGGQVVVADISGKEAAVAAELGDAAVACSMDVTDLGAAPEAVLTAVQNFGGLDVLCNNAGVPGPFGPLADQSIEAFDQVVSINLRGHFLGMRAAIPTMIERGGGSIVNIASIAALIGVAGTAAYSATKAGIVGMSRAAAVDYGKEGIRINVVCPGNTRTPLMNAHLAAHPDTELDYIDNPMGRMAGPSEIADMVVFLASDASSFVTGQVISVDGGRVAV